MRLLLACLACAALAAGEPAADALATAAQRVATEQRSAFVLVRSTVKSANGEGGFDETTQVSAGGVIDANGTIVVSTDDLYHYQDATGKDGNPVPALNNLIVITADGAEHPVTLLRNDTALGLSFVKAADGAGLHPLPRPVAARRPALGEQLLTLTLIETAFGPTLNLSYGRMTAVFDQPGALGECEFMVGSLIFDLTGAWIGVECSTPWMNRGEEDWTPHIATVERVLTAAVGESAMP